MFSKGASPPEGGKRFETDVDVSPLLFSVEEACKRAQASRATLYKDIGAGKLRAVKRGRRTFIRPADLQEYVERWPELKLGSSADGRS
jgi:excisionase family DNA binding protein